MATLSVTLSVCVEARTPPRTALPSQQQRQVERGSGGGGTRGGEAHGQRDARDEGTRGFTNRSC
ncbi:hypothetical protein E2C01_087115 [Portunus trituberculatus]|uniref:Uncharacterized protein n=1 Tax=Portunus trituberculatus TaxID=210409 RepID=A0A5B7JI70_PORTR|nr:hypothetical protein [Portunus trituberculatus]